MTNDILDALAQEVDKISDEKKEVIAEKKEGKEIIKEKIKEDSARGGSALDGESISQTSVMADFLNQQKITFPTRLFFVLALHLN